MRRIWTVSFRIPIRSRETRRLNEGEVNSIRAVMEGYTAGPKELLTGEKCFLQLSFLRLPARFVKGNRVNVVFSQKKQGISPRRCGARGALPFRLTAKPDTDFACPKWDSRGGNAKDAEGTILTAWIKVPGGSSTGVFRRSWFSGNVFFALLDKGIQRGKDASDIDNVNSGSDAVASMVFAKILSEVLIDVAG